MFTGIVEYSGLVEDLRPTSNGAALRIAVPGLPRDLPKGTSIAVNGVCLTAVALQDGRASFDVVPETLRCSNLGALAAGMSVNIELPLTPQSFVGGHFVQGHVDGLGRIARKEPVPGGDAVMLWIEVGTEVTDLLVEKGSVALDGVSLTVVDVRKSEFSCALIPYTLEKTTLGAKGPGATVNIEADVIGKYIKKYISRGNISGSVTTDLLQRSGFLS